MQLWQLASGAFFLYVALVVLWRGGDRPRDRKAIAGAVAGLLLTLVSALVDLLLLTTWIWPPLLLLIAYWSSGLLFVAPRPRQEAGLRWLDDRVGVREVARRTPRALAEILQESVGGRGEILAGIDESAIKIKDDELNHGSVLAGPADVSPNPSSLHITSSLINGASERERPPPRRRRFGEVSP